MILVSVTLKRVLRSGQKFDRVLSLINLMEGKEGNMCLHRGLGDRRLNSDAANSDV